MAYQDKFPSNQKTGQTPNPLSPTPVAAPASAHPPVGRVQEKFINTTAIGEGFRKVGNEIVQQQLPSFAHRLLVSIVDALFPGNTPTPYIGRSNYSAFTGFAGGRMPQVPQYGRMPTAYPMAPQGQPAEILIPRRSFDKFILANREVAIGVFQGLVADAAQLGYLTVSQVYDRLGAQVPYMGVNYYWTADDLSTTEITEMLTGEVTVKMPKAHIMAQ